MVVQKKHVIREIIYLFEELTLRGVPTGMVYEFDDPAIASDEMGLALTSIKEVSFRLGGTRIGNYVVSSRVIDKEVPEPICHDIQGELFA